VKELYPYIKSNKKLYTNFILIDVTYNFRYKLFKKYKKNNNLKHDILTNIK